MSKTAHEDQVLIDLEAMADSLQDIDKATVRGFTETYFFSQEDLNGNVSLYIEAHPTLRGEILAVSFTNATTEITDGGSLIVGDAGDPNGYIDTLLVPVTITANANDATDIDGVGNLWPRVKSILVGAEEQITASDLMVALFTDVSSDTGIFDLHVTSRWFE